MGRVQEVTVGQVLSAQCLPPAAAAVTPATADQAAADVVLQEAPAYLDKAMRAGHLLACTPAVAAAGKDRLVHTAHPAPMQQAEAALPCLQVVLKSSLLLVDEACIAAKQGQP
jgi:hypothetical protein